MSKVVVVVGALIVLLGLSVGMTLGTQADTADAGNVVVMVTLPLGLLVLGVGWAAGAMSKRNRKTT